MLLKTDAVVLRVVKYGDARVILDMFTREEGRLSFVTSLPATGRGRMRKQYFQPLTLLAVDCDVRPSRQLQRLRDVRLLSPYSSIPVTPEKLALVLFLSEFLYHALRDERQGEPLFSYIADSLQWLDAADSGYANFHLTFLMHMTRFLGFYPNLDVRSPLSTPLFFDLRESSFTTVVPLHTDYLPAADCERVRTLMRMDFANMHLFRLSRADRNRITDILLRYYALHVPQFPELRSLPVLQELWD